MAMSGSLDLERQLLFYGAYHHDPVNVGIHITFVPILLLTGFLFVSDVKTQAQHVLTKNMKGTNTPALPLPSYLAIPNLPANLGTIACILYSGLYILMEPVAGALLAPLLLAGTAFVNYLTSEYGMTANYIAIGVHVVSWIVQFIGHGAFEKRAPALLDNLVQAIFLAPFFVWLEILFMLGYRPELKARLDTAIEKEIAKFKAEKHENGENQNAKVPNGKEM